MKFTWLEKLKRNPAEALIGIKRGESPESAFVRAKKEFFRSSDWTEAFSPPLEELKGGEAGEVWRHYAGVLYWSPDSRDLFISEKVHVSIPDTLIEGSCHRLYYIRERLDAFDVWLGNNAIKLTVDFVNHTLDQSDGHWIGFLPQHMGKLALIEDQLDLWLAYFAPQSSAAKRLKDHLEKVELNSGRSLPYSLWGDESLTTARPSAASRSTSQTAVSAGQVAQ